VPTRHAVKAADEEIHSDQRDDQDQAAEHRGVGSGHRGLQGVRYEQDEHEVVERELPDLALAEDPERDQQPRVGHDAAKHKLPPANRQSQRRWER